MTIQNQTDYTPPGEGKWKFTGYHMIACVVAFFAVIITVNFTMAWFASDSWTGLVVKNSYVASQQFNKKLEAARLQKSLGWNASFRYSKNSAGLQVSDKNGNPVLFEEVIANFARPVSQSADTRLELQSHGAGKYKADLTLAPGVWLFTIVASGQTPYRLEGRLIVSKEGRGKLQ